MKIFTYVILIVYICSISHVKAESPPPDRAYDLECFQDGKTVVDEQNLRGLNINSETITARREDGRQIAVMGANGALCRLLEKPR